MDDSAQLPVDLSSGTDDSSNDTSLNDSTSTNLPEEQVNTEEPSGATEDTSLPVENQPVVEDAPNEDQVSNDISTGINETPAVQPEDVSINADSGNSEETSPDTDISREVLTEDTDDSESFLDDTQNI